MVRAKTILGVGDAKIPRINLVGELFSVFLALTSITREENLNTLANEILTIKQVEMARES